MNVRFHKHLKKQYKKLKKSYQKKFDEKLSLFIQSPFSPLLNNHALHGAHKDCRSIDITGDIRAVYYLFDQSIAYFITVGRHRDLYK